ncbi:unnamed protein product [Clonostachys rosea f. rosea IK726]|uniref:Uncharacterized protein n=1 Tax=Clonostachys rosea f. rosea IK726 TaxID=1349383 RepID=A0ACA9UQH2_BIOOC|nr:unnamed protein product [Clonostachys rosea f. rosea IK726]
MAARDALVPQAVAEDGYAIVPDKNGAWVLLHLHPPHRRVLVPAVGLDARYGAGAAVDTSAHVTHGDWDRLAAAFGRKKRSLAEAEAVFYKGQGRQRIRAGGLLSTLSDDEYARVCKFIVDTPTISFPTPHRIKRAYMRYLGYMMYHVIAWFDPLSAAAASAQAHTTQNKTLLHTHLEAALEKHADQSTPPAPILSSSPAALHIQKLVLDYTRKNADEFHECAVPPTALGQKFGGVDNPLYTERFSHSVWSRLLILVRGEVSSRGIGVLRNEWKVTMDGTRRRRVEVNPSTAGPVQIPDLIQEFCCQVTRAATHKRDITALPPEAAAELERSIQQAVEKLLQPSSRQHHTTKIVVVAIVTAPGLGVSGMRVGEAGEDRPTSSSSSDSAVHTAAVADGGVLPGFGPVHISLPETR